MAVSAKVVVENNTEVNSNINVEANTGGNTAESGEMVKGEAEAGIKIKTEINGETVTDIDITETGDDEAKIEVKNTVTADNDTAKSETVTKVNDEVKRETAEVDLNEPQAADETMNKTQEENTADETIEGADVDTSADENIGEAPVMEEGENTEPAEDSNAGILATIINSISLFFKKLLSIFT
jgi:hypothetical protein